MKLAEAYVEIVGKDAKFRMGLRGLRGQLDKFGRHTQRISRVARRALLGMVAGLAAVTYAAAKQEAADRQLADALAGIGANVAESLPQLKAYASGLQRITTYGDEAIEALMTIGLNLGVTRAQIEKTTKMSLGLATALQMDVNTAMRYTALALQGEFTILQRYIPALRFTTDRTEKLALVTNLARRGFQQLEGQTKTVRGAAIQLKNAFGDLLEQMGGIVFGGKDAAETLGRIREKIRGLTTGISGLTPELKKSIKKFALWTGGILAALAALPLLVIAIKALATALAFTLAHPLGAVIGLLVGGAGIYYAVGKVRGAFDDLRSTMGGLRTDLKKLTEDWEYLTKAQREAEITAISAALGRVHRQRHRAQMEALRPGLFGDPLDAQRRVNQLTQQRSELRALRRQLLGGLAEPTVARPEGPEVEQGRERQNIQQNIFRYQMKENILRAAGLEMEAKRVSLALEYFRRQQEISKLFKNDTQERDRQIALAGELYALQEAALQKGKKRRNKLTTLADPHGYYGRVFAQHPKVGIPTARATPEVRELKTANSYLKTIVSTQKQIQTALTIGNAAGAVLF